MATKINNNLTKLDKVNVVAKFFENGLALDKTGYTEIIKHNVSEVFKVNRDNINQTTRKMYGKLSVTPVIETYWTNDNNTYNMFFLEESKYTLSGWTFDYTNNQYTTTSGAYLIFNVLKNVSEYGATSIEVTLKKLNSFSDDLNVYAYDSSLSSWATLNNNTTTTISISSGEYLKIKVAETTSGATYDIFDSKGKPNGLKISYKLYS